MFHISAALAEFERDLIQERTTAGLAAARARGRKGGRPTVMIQPKVRIARQMYASRQYTVAAIAAALGQPPVDLPPPRQPRRLNCGIAQR